MWEHRGKVAVVGVGHSRVLRRDDDTSEHNLGALAVDSALKAVGDAGLRVADIDGLAAAPHQPFGGAGHEEGIDEVTSGYLIRTMGLKNITWNDDSGGMVGHAMSLAIEAVAAGACTYALVVRAMHNPQEGRYGHSGPLAQDVARGPDQFQMPYGFAGPSYHSIYYQRYLWKYQERRENMAALAINSRKNGLIYEHSYWYQNRPEPLTMGDYLKARMISAPLNLYDCDIPVQGSAAFIVTTAERSKDLKQPPAYVLGHAIGRHLWRSTAPALEDFEEQAATLGQKLWEASGIGPRDVSLANLYDGYLCITPIWLESLGFCGRGEALQFFQEGRIAIGGAFPLNTSGGNNGGGRMHGVPHILESILQVQGRAGKRQVRNATVAVAVIGPPNSGQGLVVGQEPR